MDTNRLHQFKVLIETGNLRKAAELLGISHGGLSRSIKILENDLGTKLITADGRGFRPTPSGLEIYRKVDEVIRVLDELKSNTGTGAEITHLRLGTFEIFLTHLSSRLVRAFPTDWEISLQAYFPGSIEAALAAGHIDIGITSNPFAHPLVEHVQVSEFESKVYTVRGSELQSWRFEKIPFVAPQPIVSGSTRSVRSLDGWPNEGAYRYIKYPVSLMETGLELVRDGHAAAYLPKFVVDIHNEKIQEKFQLVPLKLSRKINYVQPIYFSRRRGDPESIAHRSIAKVLRKLN